MQTTDAPGLREAINRLRRIKAGEDPFLVYGHMMTDDTRAVHPFHQREWVWERQQDDHETIADDWLATHPSDGGEAISEEWLREIGWTFNGKWWSSPLNSVGNSIVVIDIDNGPEWSFGQMSFGFLMIPEQKTRDDLRHLLAALGCGGQQTTKGTKNVD